MIARSTCQHAILASTCKTHLVAVSRQGCKLHWIAVIEERNLDPLRHTG